MEPDSPSTLESFKGQLAALRTELEEQKRSVRNTTEATNQKLQEIPKITASANREAPEEFAPVYEKTQRDKEYRQQERLIFVTFMAFVAAVIYAGIAWHQLREMKAATEAAREQLTETKNTLDSGLSEFDRTMKQTLAQTDAQARAAKAAEDSIKATQEQMRLDERAWIGIEQIKGEPKIGERFFATIVIKNSGKTPATAVHVLHTVESIRKGNHPAHMSDSVAEQSSATIAPNAQRSIPSVTAHMPMDQATLDTMKTGEIAEYSYGTVTYFDIFGCSHWLNFCFYLDKDTTHWDDCDSHNDTGDYQCKIKKP